MVPEQPAEPPVRKHAVLAPYDNPEWRKGGRFMWAACESVVMDWATGYNGLVLGSTGCDDVRELCTDLQQ